MSTANIIRFVWVFSGVGSTFATGIFDSREEAEAWIRKHGLTGILTKYPVNIGAYDWAVSTSLFKPKKPEHMEAHFIGKFGGAAFEHYHYEDGKRN